MLKKLFEDEEKFIENFVETQNQNYNDIGILINEVVSICGNYMESIFKENELDEILLFEFLKFLNDLFEKIEKLKKIGINLEIIMEHIYLLLGDKGLNLFYKFWEICLSNKFDIKIISKFHFLGNFI